MTPIDRATAAVSKVAFGLAGGLIAPRLSILIFHRVLGALDPLFPDQLDFARFDQLLDAIGQAFRVMTLGEALTHLEQKSLPPRSLVLTFDDGYADNAEVALPILRRHGMAASFFVATGFLDGGRMWNDTVIEAVRASPLDTVDLGDFGLDRLPLGTTEERRAAIDALLRRVKYKPFGERDLAAQRIVRLLRCEKLPGELMMRREQVRELHLAGMEIGAHTKCHPILTCLPLEDAKHEITAGRDELVQIIQSPVDVMAYPNGQPTRDYGPEHVEAVRQAGFRGAVTTAPGVARLGDDVFQLPRFTPWDRGHPSWFARLFVNQWRTAFEVARPPGEDAIR